MYIRVFEREISQERARFKHWWFGSRGCSRDARNAGRFQGDGAPVSKSYRKQRGRCGPAHPRFAERLNDPGNARKYQARECSGRVENASTGLSLFFVLLVPFPTSGEFMSRVLCFTCHPSRTVTSAVPIRWHDELWPPAEQTLGLGLNVAPAAPNHAPKLRTANGGRLTIGASHAFPHSLLLLLQASTRNWIPSSLELAKFRRSILDRPDYHGLAASVDSRGGAFGSTSGREFRPWFTSM